MDNRLDSLSKYFQEKERKKLNNLVKNSGNGLPTMTLDEIKLCCVENNGYETPELNDKLYLHFRGYKKIENLDAYIGCKALWLDSNGLTAIENLSTMLELRCLYLGKNLISKIEGLESLTCLHTIDLSYNRISCVENLSCCPSLKSIVLARNNLTSADSIRHLVACSALECVDVTNNMLQGDDVMDVFASMSALRTLSVNGNEVTKLPAFRKRAIAAMPKVGYLDRPIDELERKVCYTAISLTVKVIISLTRVSCMYRLRKPS
jgi:dynein assembly factor 1